MSQTSNPHRGFDFATTVSGETVPTKFDRELARELRELSSTRVVGWSGTHGMMAVHTDNVTEVLKRVGEAFDERPAGDVSVTATESATAEKTVEIKPDV